MSTAQNGAGVELHRDKAITDFSQGFNCSQSVFAAFAVDMGMQRADALRVSAAFGSGVGRSGGVCGVVTGALMALGLRHGMIVADAKAKEQMYVLAQDFMSRFAARHGTITCKELLGCDVSTAEGRQMARERDTHHTVCADLVRDACDLLDDMLK
jgi:C_GCAxxG_C_C family probable redox protein